MNILLLKDCAGHSKGDTIETEEGHGNTIIGLGFARKVEDAPKMEKLEGKPIDKIEIKKGPKKPRK